MRTNVRMEEELSSAELLSRQEKQQTNELYETNSLKLFIF